MYSLIIRMFIQDHRILKKNARACRICPSLWFWLFNVSFIWSIWYGPYDIIRIYINMYILPYDFSNSKFTIKTFICEVLIQWNKSTAKLYQTVYGIFLTRTHPKLPILLKHHLCTQMTSLWVIKYDILSWHTKVLYMYITE